MADAGNNWYWAIVNVLVQFQTPGIGDINGESIVNVLDVVMLVNIILDNIQADEIQFHTSDVNHDDLANVVDVILLVNYIIDM